MAKQKQLTDDISVNQDFKLLTRSYQEHAIGQINFARFSVLSAREFSEDLTEIFADVQMSYSSSLMKKDSKSTIKKNGKDVWILITANNKLYGDLIIRICKLFLERIQKTNQSDVDIIVVGRQGKKFMDDHELNRPYKYYDVPDVNVTSNFLKEICESLISYEKIIAFYGKFNNLVSQNPIEAYISGEILESVVSGLDSKKKQDYLFEPSLDEIFNFFEEQILSLLLNQTVQEAQLARFASRINAMETAQTNIQKQLDRLLRKEKMLKNMQSNKKQLELLAGRSLWRRQ